MLHSEHGDIAVVAGSPLSTAGTGHRQDSPAVSPRLKHTHVSPGAQASPTISALDGTPLHLLPLLPPATAPAVPLLPPLDMARKPVYAPPAPEDDQDSGHEECLPAKARREDVLLNTPTPPPPVTTLPDLHVPPPATDPRLFPSVSEISHLLRLREYEVQRCCQVQAKFHSLQVANARACRLLRAASSVQYTLAECIRAEDKPGFVNLFNACHDALDARSICPPLPAGQESSGLDGVVPLASSFLQDLSSSACATVLECLSLLKYNGNFIADRLAALTHRELVALLPDRSSSATSASILGSIPSRSSRSPKPLGFVVDAHVDVLASQAFATPLETLVYAVHGGLAEAPASASLMTDVWATVSARLLQDQKLGGQHLVPALLDIWSAMFPWPGKDRLEVWIMNTVQQGAFLLDQQSKQTFRARAQARQDTPTDEEARLQSFYSHATDSLLDLISSRAEPSIIPPGAVMLCHAIWSKLQPLPEQQRAFPPFAITRWLFATFIPDVVTLPEASGMMTDFYISDSARQRILREIACRAQQAVFGVTYKWTRGAAIASETVQRVRDIMARIYEDRPFVRRGSPPFVPGPSHSLATAHEAFAVVSVSDVSTVLKALYPQRRPASVSSDRDTLRSGLHSSASSTSGFSMFRSVDTANMQYDQVAVGSPDGPDGPGSAFPIAAQDAAVPIVDSASTAESFHLFLDLARTREACIELDDLAVNRGPNSKKFWAVIVEDVHTRVFRTVPQVCPVIADLDAFLAARSVNAEKFAAEPSCIEPVEALLRRRNIPDQRHSIPEPCSSEETFCTVKQQLNDLFELEILDLENEEHYFQAHKWTCRYKEFQQSMSSTAGRIKLQTALEQIRQTANDQLARAVLLTNICETWLRQLKAIAELERRYLRPFGAVNQRLRDKMWYVADVRTSAPYDEARIVASALRVMGKPKRTPRTRLAPPLRHWTSPKTSNGGMHLKTEAQVLELLSTRPEHGGPNKLSDEQSTATVAWMQRQHIHNLCAGEERLHKMCMEIRKCVDEVSAPSIVENPTIWSNSLFARDQPIPRDGTLSMAQTLLPESYSSSHNSGFLSLSRTLNQRPSTASSASHSLSASSRERMDTRSPTLTNRSSITFWSPAVTEAGYPASATSVCSFQTQAYLGNSPPQRMPEVTPDSQSALEKLRERLTSLLLSDLAATMFSHGSETDQAYCTGVGRSVAEDHVRAKNGHLRGFNQDKATTGEEVNGADQAIAFNFDGVFNKILAKFSATPNPFTKLKCLHEIEQLLGPFMAQANAGQSSTSLTDPSIAYRQQTSNGNGVQHPVNATAVQGFSAIFSRSFLRPSTLFRDMQYVASLVPSTVLEGTARGDAFFNAALAVTQYKQEVLDIMVETADSIIAYHSNNRGGGRTSSAAQQQRDSATFSSPSRASSAEEVARYTMPDAASLLQISAKEGHPVAQRELATLYLTNPELMEHIIQPFARPHDVFKEELESKWRKNQDPARCDPTTMCVAHHWMSLSSKAGDALATEFLRQREEMDRLP